MDVKDIATYGTAVAVIGTGTVVGGNVAIDNATGGPQKRIEAERTELQLIVRAVSYTHLTLPTIYSV